MVQLLEYPVHQEQHKTEQYCDQGTKQILDKAYGPVTRTWWTLQDRTLPTALLVALLLLEHLVLSDT